MRRGLLLMLKAYNGSGTHGGRGVVVMGGLVGAVDQWEAFEVEWAALLADPLPKAHKPPLRMFHLSHCRNHWGEFADYSDAESDAVTHDFRRLVMDAGLFSFAAAIEREPWRELAATKFGSDIGACVGRCIEAAIGFASDHPLGDSAGLVFDRGMWTQELEIRTTPFTYPLVRPRIRSITACTVEDVLPLQAADIVATENYWHALEVLKLGIDAAPRAHMQHYLGEMPHLGVILDRPAIEALIG
jgi:hypothetical protein